MLVGPGFGLPACAFRFLAGRRWPVCVAPLFLLGRATHKQQTAPNTTLPQLRACWQGIRNIVKAALPSRDATWSERLSYVSTQFGCSACSPRKPTHRPPGCAGLSTTTANLRCPACASTCSLLSSRRCVLRLPLPRPPRGRSLRSVRQAPRNTAGRAWRPSRRSCPSGRTRRWTRATWPTLWSRCPRHAKTPSWCLSWMTCVCALFSSWANADERPGLVWIFFFKN